MGGNNCLTQASVVYTVGDYMALKKYSFWAEGKQLDGLRFVADRDGIRESEQIRRAINAWLEKKGVMKSDRKRPAGKA